MVPWWKRLIFSLVSVEATGSVCGAIVLFPHFLREATGHHSALGSLGMFLFFEFLVLTLTFPCWLLASPMILIATNLRGWRFWMYWAIGSFIGPLYWFGRKLMGLDTNSKLYGGPYGVIVVVSVLASLIYLVVIRRAEYGYLNAAQLRRSWCAEEYRIPFLLPVRRTIASTKELSHRL